MSHPTEARIPEHVHDGPLVGAARTAEAAAHRVKERVIETRDRLAQKSIGDLVEDSRSYVRESPLKTVAIAAGIGIGLGALAGFLYGRRRE